MCESCTPVCRALYKKAFAIRLGLYVDTPLLSDLSAKSQQMQGKNLISCGVSVDAVAAVG
jgi:hypothetical protein